MFNFTPLLQQAIQENRLTVDTQQIEKLNSFLQLLQTWNKVYNLTAITDPREMVYLHIIDSLLVQTFLHGTRLLDVGSGGGLPGIPLAILNPHQHWVLLDKNSKKTRFITQAAAELALKNVEAVHSRVEDFHPAEHFDSILSRAFSTLGLFTESTAHLLNPNGKFIAMKGKHPEEELAELPPRFHIQNVTRLEMQGMKVDRHIIIVTM